MRIALLPSLLALTLSTATLSHADERSWLANTIATCQQSYDEESCNDPVFLEEHYHASSLQIAHKAATRGKLEEQRALRELSLQRLCGQSSKNYCSGETDGLCAQQIAQMCADIRQRAALCLIHAEQFCANSTEPNCLNQQAAFCPSVKKQNINVLLAKYPKLSPVQKNRLAQVAQGLDNKNRGLIGDLFRWLGF